MTTPLSRRHFLGASAGAAAAAWALPALSWARARGSNDRITIGVIGTGGMGTSHLHSLKGRLAADNIAVTRVCDVYRRRLNNAAKVIDGSASADTMEYRELLDDKSLDAVLIATPDHWHTKMAIDAMDAGKNVYCEKPLSLTIEQALACRDAVKRTGKVLQVGPQYTSLDSTWKARDAIAAGRIGKVVWSQSAYCRNSRGGQFNWTIDPDAGPSQDKSAEGYVDWNRWLGLEHGLAASIPWNADHFFRFRKYFAYNGGVATDLLYHKLAPLLLAITGPDGEYPKRVVASGGKFLEKDERDIPDTFMMMIDYPSEHTIVLASVMTNDVGLDTVIRGQYGTLAFKDGSDWGDQGKLAFSEQGVWAPEFRKKNADKVSVTTTKNADGKDVTTPANGQAVFEIACAKRRDHVGNWLDSIRGTAKPDCNIDLGCSTMVAIKMGVEAYRQNKVMTWDAEKEKVVGG
ncbi:MAG: Gfo/Idh/MocA family protein [Phycisphaerales bacterium]